MENYEEVKDVRVKKHIVLKTFITIILLAIIGVLFYIIADMSTASKEYYISEKNLQIPIFVYHDVVKDKSEIEYDYMQITADDFENQIVHLMAYGYKPISYQDLKDYKEGKKALSKHSFLITFDDGYDGVYDYAFKIAKKYKIPMTSFEINNEVGKTGYYKWRQLKEMAQSEYMDIYLHGLEHKEYDKETPEKLVEDTNKAYQTLAKSLRNDSLLKVFTYPYGLYTEEQITALEKEGYIQNLTDNKVNESKNLNLSKLHRCYPLNDSLIKILTKIHFRVLRYGSK